VCPDGTLDTAFNPNANGIVYSIAVQADGKILVCGQFNTIGGQTRNSIARLDAATGLADSFDPNANSAGLHPERGAETPRELAAETGACGKNFKTCCLSVSISANAAIMFTRCPNSAASIQLWKNACHHGFTS
jgi:hypothetical protein